jgi:hypothetical protein
VHSQELAPDVRVVDRPKSGQTDGPSTKMQPSKNTHGNDDAIMMDVRGFLSRIDVIGGKRPMLFSPI